MTNDELSSILDEKLKEIADEWKKQPLEPYTCTGKGYASWIDNDKKHFKDKMTKQELINQGYSTWGILFAEFFEDQKVKDKMEFVAVGENLLTWRQALQNPQFKSWFYPGFGGVEGVPFTAWSKDWVYFPVCYDGKEWVARVPRNPCTHITEHVGGG